VTAPLSWNDIRANAQRFAAEWRGEKSERAEAQTFWNEFFEVFGVKRRRVAVFERAVQRLKYGDRAPHGRIDVLWPGVLLAEHKSAGADLDAAFTQAGDYFAGLADAELPHYVVVSDFARIRLYDLDDHARPLEFKLAELPRKIHLFGFVSGYRKQCASRTRSTSMPSPVWANCTTCSSATATAATRWKSFWCDCSFASLPTTPASSSPRTAFAT
jgi:hypothetical protein